MLENLKKYKIVLASNSPRRRNLLSGLDIDFEVRVIPDIDESYPDSIDSMEIPLYIARSKAEAYKSTMADDELLITADTISGSREKIIRPIRLGSRKGDGVIKPSLLGPLRPFRLPNIDENTTSKDGKRGGACAPPPPTIS